MIAVDEPTARIVDVATMPDGTVRVALAFGDRLSEHLWPGHPPKIGDIVCVPDASDLSSAVRIGGVHSGAWDALGDGMRWRRTVGNGPSRLETLRQRHTIRTAVRAFFDKEEFIEIDTPLLVRGTTPDAAIASFAVGERYLVTSTEYQIKRSIAGGVDRAYTLTQNFRQGEAGRHHNPEFTMLEWARTGAALEKIEQDAEAFVCQAYTALGGGDSLIYQGHAINLRPPWQRLTVAEAIWDVLGVRLPDFSLTSLQDLVQTLHVPIRAERMGDRVFLFTIILDRVQSGLGHQAPVFLRDWPAFLTSSAYEKSPDGIADRSELFVAGLEIGDGFAFLTDFDRQKTGFDMQLARRVEEGLPAVTLDAAYLEALRIGLPPGAGMAIGFDRLVMLLTDRADIKSVLAFAWDEV
ncbi:MAG: amino acid--tRNA ligase-related protein [Hyphomicrobiaceae bacterium]